MQVEAIYRHGVFEPLEPVNLFEEQRVTLDVRELPKESLEDSLKRIQELQDRIFKRQGYFPDSTPDIAADRLR